MSRGIRITPWSHNRLVKLAAESDASTAVTPDITADSRLLVTPVPLLLLPAVASSAGRYLYRRYFC
jgi:hypothetical protein